MDMETMEKKFNALTRQLWGILQAKNHDYANSEDVFANFTLISQITGLSVEQVFFVFIGVKVARLKELFKGKDPKNESIDDTLVDLINYTILLNIYRRGEK